MKRLPWIMSALLAATMFGEARAAIIAYDGFANGTPGLDLVGNDGGTGFNSPWLPGGFNASQFANYDIGAGSLASNNLSTSGNRATTASTTSIAGLRRVLSRTIGPNETFYLSVLLRPEGTVGEGAFGGFFGLYLDSTNGDANDLYLGKPGEFNQYALETRGGTGRSLSNFTAVSGQTTLLTLKGELRTGTDLLTLWVNRPLGGGDPTSFDAQKADLDLVSFNALVIYSTGAFSIDEIRIGQTYADVTPAVAAVPEPSTLLSAASGVTGLLLVARRRRKGTTVAVPSRAAG
ncbi:MAG TPA: PEP-CTERM sorting domain-containing protein [Isosphaeraceae bacterium]